MKRVEAAIWVVIVGTLTVPVRGQDSPEILQDPAGDVVVRRTDLHADGALHPQSVMPDLLYVALGGWYSGTPRTNPYNGAWMGGDDADLYRVDVAFRELVNPPGPNGLRGPEYDPFRYGPSPVYGFLEFDPDNELDTGGEIEFVANRLLGNASRFGGRFEEGLGERQAVSGDDLDHDLRTQPAVERSGEEWHLGLCGCDEFQVVETYGDLTPDSFDAGDTWVLRGRFLHRTHAFTEYSFAFGGSRPGEYDPVVLLRFKHERSSRRTVISLVGALTQRGAAQLEGQPQQPWDLDVSNHTSIEEMIREIQFTAVNSPDPGQGTSFDLLRDWADDDHEEWDEFRDPAEWRVNALFGTAYLIQEPDAAYVWTDIGFEHVLGDVDGDGRVGDSDVDAIRQFVALADGGADDDDRVVNGQVYMADFGPNFVLYDLNYDGAVNALDVSLIGYYRTGDVNLDGQLDAMDVAIVDGLNGTQRSDPAYNPAADFNHDDQIDAVDGQLIRILMGPRAISLF